MAANRAALTAIIKIRNKIKKQAAVKLSCFFCPWKRSHVVISFVRRCFVRGKKPSQQHVRHAEMMYPVNIIYAALLQCNFIGLVQLHMVIASLNLYGSNCPCIAAQRLLGQKSLGPEALLAEETGAAGTEAALALLRPRGTAEWPQCAQQPSIGIPACWGELWLRAITMATVPNLRGEQEERTTADLASFNDSLSAPSPKRGASGSMTRKERLSPLVTSGRWESMRAPVQRPTEKLRQHVCHLVSRHSHLGGMRL